MKMKFKLSLAEFHANQPGNGVGWFYIYGAHVGQFIQSKIFLADLSTDAKTSSLLDQSLIQ